jgi:chromosome segregation ATPase
MTSKKKLKKQVKRLKRELVALQRDYEDAEFAVAVFQPYYEKHLQWLEEQDEAGPTKEEIELTEAKWERDQYKAAAEDTGKTLTEARDEIDRLKSQLRSAEVTVRQQVADDIEKMIQEFSFQPEARSAALQRAKMVALRGL